jgi:hypothetical protein
MGVGAWDGQTGPRIGLTAGGVVYSLTLYQLFVAGR